VCAGSARSTPAAWEAACGCSVRDGAGRPSEPLAADAGPVPVLRAAGIPDHAGRPGPGAQGCGPAAWAPRPQRACRCCWAAQRWRPPDAGARVLAAPLCILAVCKLAEKRAHMMPAAAHVACQQPPLRRPASPAPRPALWRAPTQPAPGRGLQPRSTRARGAQARRRSRRPARAAARTRARPRRRRCRSG